MIQSNTDKLNMKNQSIGSKTQTENNVSNSYSREKLEMSVYENTILDGKIVSNEKSSARNSLKRNNFEKNSGD